MKHRNIWLCAAAVLALGACDRIKGAQKPPVVKAAAAPVAPKPAPAVAPAEAAKVGDAPQSQKTVASGALAGAARAKAPARKRTASLAGARSGRTSGPAVRSRIYASTSGPRTGAGTIAGAAGPTGAPMVQDATYSAEYQACVAKARGFTLARADCHSAELARQGQRLNQAYDSAANRSAGGRERFEATQRDWTNERDASCRAQAERSGADLLQEGSCRLDMTIQRANGLAREAG